MKNSRNRRFNKMHVSELYAAARKGNDAALTELIDRQQDGRSLRYYPDGRKGPEDEGLVPVQIESKDGFLSIRSGRPNRKIIINKDTVEVWVKGIPDCLFHAANEHKRSGVDAEDILDVMTEGSMDDFNANLYQTEGDEETLTCEFLPPGESRWIVSPRAASNLVRRLLELCEENDWYFDVANESESAAILKLLKLGDGN